MKIILSPVRMDNDIAYIKHGDSIIVDGEVFDFSQVGDGDTLPREAILSSRFGGDVDRVEGELILTLILPLPANYSYEQAFPEPLYQVVDGPLLPYLPKPLPELLSEEISTDE